MNEQDPMMATDRSRWAARFHARLFRYRNLLVQRWWIPLLCVFLALAIQGALSWFSEPRFVSIGRMIMSGKLSIQETSVYTEELSNFLGTQQQLMKSSTVINRAHARASAQRPEFGIQSVSMDVGVLPKSTIFVLSASGSDPQYTQTFLQSAMEEYLKVKSEMREKTSGMTVTKLTDQILKLERDLGRADAALTEFQSSNSVVLLQQQGNTEGSRLAEMKSELARLKSEFDLLSTMTPEQGIEIQQQIGRNDTRGEPNASKTSTEMDFAKASQDILMLQAEMATLQDYLRPKHPKMISIADEIYLLEEKRKILRNENAGQLANRMSALTLLIKNKEKDIEHSDKLNLEISGKNAEYLKLKANKDRTQALYDRLLQTMQTLDVNAEVSPEAVSIMEAAGSPYAERPPVIKSLITAGLIGLALSIGLLMLLDKLDDRMNTFTEVQDMFDQEILGQIPFEKPPGKNGHMELVQQDDNRHSFVEAYRNLRSSLLYMAETGNRSKTLLVTSCVPNDGKSTTAANLAVTLAISGSKVLLVDADLRKGALNHRFAVAAEPGLSNALTSGADWKFSVIQTAIPNLAFLPRGATTQRSSEFFVNQVTRDFLNEAKSLYDYVIVDTAPVMAADDVTSLAPLIDGTIFVLRAGQTSTRVARAALDLLYQRKVNILGLVFNGVRSASGDYYYYYRYKDYYKPYPGNKN